MCSPPGGPVPAAGEHVATLQAALQAADPTRPQQGPAGRGKKSRCSPLSGALTCSSEGLEPLSLFSGVDVEATGCWFHLRCLQCDFTSCFRGCGKMIICFLHTFLATTHLVYIFSEFALKFNLVYFIYQAILVIFFLSSYTNFFFLQPVESSSSYMKSRPEKLC